MRLDETILKKYCQDVSKKTVLAINEPEVTKEFLKYIQMQHDFMISSNAYEIASMMRSFSTWYKNKDKEPLRVNADKRAVYYVDLGAFNLKYEEGFIHPCVVIKRYGDRVLVIPGSTKKYGENNPLIFDIDAGNGFKENTGVMLDQIRIVSTTRLITKLKFGKVSIDTFDEMMDKFMEKFISKKFHEFNKLKIKKDKLEVKLNEYENEINKLKNQIEVLEKSTKCENKA